MDENIQFLYGEQEDLPQGNVSGSLLFTTDEGHIYLDMGSERTEFYKKDLDNKLDKNPESLQVGDVNSSQFIELDPNSSSITIYNGQDERPARFMLRDGLVIDAEKVSLLSRNKGITIPEPVDSTDAATKNYVDNQLKDLYKGNIIVSLVPLYFEETNWQQIDDNKYSLSLNYDGAYANLLKDSASYYAMVNFNPSNISATRKRKEIISKNVRYLGREGSTFYFGADGIPKLDDNLLDLDIMIIKIS